MKKILIADLIGTLIPQITMARKYLEKSGFTVPEFSNEYDEADYLKDILAEHLKEEISTYLKEGNDLIVVTMPRSHGQSARNLFTDYIIKIAHQLRQYKSQIQYFMVYKKYHDEFLVKKLSTVANVFEKDGITYAQDDNALVTCIDRKIEVYDFVNTNNSRLYSIGDNIVDIPMLLKCVELGGDSALIDFNLNFCNLTIDEIIELICYDYQLFNHPRGLTPYESFEILDRLYKEKKESLYELLKNGELDRNELLREQIVNKVINEYINPLSFAGKNIEEHEAEVAKLDISTGRKLSLYPSFKSYSEKVLNR